MRITQRIALFRTALQDGASIAGLLMTTEGMVAEKPKKETPMPAMQ
jgi:chaperonin GroEL